MRRIGYVRNTNIDELLRMSQFELKNHLTSILEAYNYKTIIGDGYLLGTGNVVNTDVLLVAHLDNTDTSRCETSTC